MGLHLHRTAVGHHHNTALRPSPPSHGALDEDLAAVVPAGLRDALPELGLDVLFTAYSLARHDHSPETIAHQLQLPLGEACIIGTYAQHHHCGGNVPDDTRRPPLPEGGPVLLRPSGRG